MESKAAMDSPHTGRCTMTALSAHLTPWPQTCGVVSEAPGALLQVLHLAERLFSGLPEEVIVLRTSCELALSKRDVGAALKKLRAVPPASPLYRAARAAFAEITLRYRSDERQFIAAHVDIVTTFKDYDARVSAGDAFLSIQVRAAGTHMYNLYGIDYRMHHMPVVSEQSGGASGPRSSRFVPHPSAEEPHSTAGLASTCIPDV